MRKIFENQLSEMDVSPFNSNASHVSVHNARNILKNYKGGEVGLISGASLFANNRSFICGALLFLPSSRKFERGRFMNKTCKAILNQIRQQFNGSKCSCNRRKIGHVDYKVWVIFQWYYKSENYIYSYVSSLILLIFKPFSNSFTYMFNVWLAL